MNGEHTLYACFNGRHTFVRMHPVLKAQTEWHPRVALGSTSTPHTRDTFVDAVMMTQRAW